MRVSGITYVQGRNSYVDADGTKYGIAIHNTSNTASADAEASYATRRTDGVSAHFYADGTKVIQSLDTTARAGHAGSSQGNQNAVAVEIRGVNGWPRDTWLNSVCWDLLGQVLAQVCRTYGIAVRRASVAEMQANPKVRAFYSHDDMRRAWGGTDHDDPGPNFPWDRLFAAVNAALNPQEADVNLTDTVLGTGTAASGGKDRTVAQVLGDMANLRAVLIGEKAATAGGFGPATPLGQVLALGAAGPAKPLDVSALAAALAPVLAEHLDGEVSQDQIVAALTSDAGQAALTAAANKAEDS